MFQKLFLRRVREVKVCTISKGEGHVGQEKDTFPGSLLKGGERGLKRFGRERRTQKDRKRRKSPVEVGKVRKRRKMA